MFLPPCKNPSTLPEPQPPHRTSTNLMLCLDASQGHQSGLEISLARGCCNATTVLDDPGKQTTSSRGLQGCTVLDHNNKPSAQHNRTFCHFLLLSFVHERLTIDTVLVPPPGCVSLLPNSFTLERVASSAPWISLWTTPRSSMTLMIPITSSRSRS